MCMFGGAHMMLFFMAFVFGSLCTCCFHRLMYMFDEKCVLFPKIVSHYSIHRILSEFFSYKQSQLKEDGTENPEMKETDYVTTQWAENSVCYLPTYVPLVSGLGGLVWTTMFLMCSSGTSNVPGSQRYWRALPFMFFFALTMSILCIYASIVTHSGLREFCSKMAEATGTSSCRVKSRAFDTQKSASRCSYNVNVASLAFERRIHAVYQATRLSIGTAWLHTMCWVLSTLLILARVLLAVDFTLVHVKVQLVGNLDDILLKHEKQIDSFNAESAIPIRFDIDEDDSEVELFTTSNTIKNPKKTALDSQKEPTLYPQLAQSPTSGSPPEKRKTLLNKYLAQLLHDLLKAVGKRDQSTQTETHLNKDTSKELKDTESTEGLANEFVQILREKLTQEINDFEHRIKSYINNKEGSGNTENSTIKIDDAMKNKKPDDSKNEIDNIEYGKTKQGGKGSSTEIDEINFDKGTSTKTDKNETKDEDIVIKGKVNEREQLHISNDPDDENKPASIKEHDKTDKDQKKDGTDDRQDSRGADDKDKNKENKREQLHISDDPDDENKPVSIKEQDKTDKDQNKDKKKDRTDDREDSRGADDKDKNKET